MRSERQKIRRNEREREQRVLQQIVKERALRTAPKPKAFSHLICRYCNEKIEDCSNRTKTCSNCKQNVAICAEKNHQKTIFCRAATAARAVGARGLVRSPADAIVPMLDEANIPYEKHPTRVTNWSGKGLVVVEEAWIPPETIAIIQANRPLADRMAALRKFGEYLARRLTPAT